MSGRTTPEHLAKAAEFRQRAARCQLSAKHTLSAKFGDCYRLLADYYTVLADLEEDFVARQTSALLENKLIAAE